MRDADVLKRQPKGALLAFSEVLSLGTRVHSDVKKPGRLIVCKGYVSKLVNNCMIKSIDSHVVPEIGSNRAFGGEFLRRSHSDRLPFALIIEGADQDHPMPGYKIRISYKGNSNFRSSMFREFR